MTTLDEKIGVDRSVLHNKMMRVWNVVEGKSKRGQLTKYGPSISEMRKRVFT